MSVETEKRYKSPDGTIITEEEGRELYGEDFDMIVAEGQLVEVDASEMETEDELPTEEVEEVSADIYVTPDGLEVTEEDARAEYGDDFDAVMASGQLKKKDGIVDTADTSTTTPQMQEAPVAQKDFRETEFLEKQQETLEGLDLQPRKRDLVIVDIDKNVDLNSMLLDGNTVSLEKWIDEAGEGEAKMALIKKYEKYGFEFKEAEGGLASIPGMDYLDVTSFDGKKHRLSLDPFGNTYDEAEAFKQFIRENAVDKSAEEMKDVEEQGDFSLGESTPEIDALVNKVTQLSNEDPEANKEEIANLNAEISALQKSKIKKEASDYRESAFKVGYDLEWDNLDDQLGPLRKERATATEARKKEIDKEIANIRWEAGMAGKINIAEEEIMRLEARINDIESNPADTKTKNIGYDPKFPQYEEVPVLSKAQEAEIARLEGKIDEMIAENPALETGELSLIHI